MDLVLFDLDNTLLEGDSDFEWANFLITKGVLDKELQSARNRHFMQQYEAGTLDIFEFLEFQLAPLSRHARTQLDAWHAEFMVESIRPLISDLARAEVHRHFERGALIAIVTATNSFVTGPIAREFGIDHLVATIAEQQQGAPVALTAQPGLQRIEMAHKIQRRLGIAAGIVDIEPDTAVRHGDRRPFGLFTRPAHGEIFCLE